MRRCPPWRARWRPAWQRPERAAASARAGEATPGGCAVGSMESSAFPLRSWHPHVYAKPPKSPTPHSIAHILGIRDDTLLAVRPQLPVDQPLNLSFNDTKRQPASEPPASPVASSPAHHDAAKTSPKTSPSPLPALVAPNLQMRLDVAADTDLAITVRGSGLAKGTASGEQGREHLLVAAVLALSPSPQRSFACLTTCAPRPRPRPVGHSLSQRANRSARLHSRRVSLHETTPLN